MTVEQDRKSIYRERIAGLRELMAAEGLDAYIVVTDDFHGSEYVGDYFKCREFLTGFDGSAGTLVVTAGKAGLWTDGRYFLQAGDQLAGTGIELERMGEAGVPTIAGYLAAELGEAAAIGYDGRTISGAYGDRLKQSLPGRTFREDLDLAGRLWKDRPEFPHGGIWPLAEEYCGRSVESKLEYIRKEMQGKGCDLHMMAALDDIAWTCNFRGCDIDYNPVALAYMLISQEEAVLYMAEDAADPAMRALLEKAGIGFRSYGDIYEDVKTLAPGRILVDPATVNTRLLAALPEGLEAVRAGNPAAMKKAVKNELEQENEVLAHIKDGVAVTRLIYWIKNRMPAGTTELEMADRLEQLRWEGADYLGQSFAPIIAAGAHGAIVHYEASPETNAPLEEGTFVLMDTGGHYLQGTTDITRTVALGSLSHTQKLHYTAVLKGNLNIGGAYFKRGVTGSNLDYLARNPLWELGLDYNHGTGHGVGYLLNVHEGPNSIRLRNSDTPFQPGMITSNEPGVYLAGEYGIRLENLILCREADREGFLNFETLTLVPFDREAILADRLSSRQKKLLNDYHSRVYEVISSFLDEAERRWLEEVTRPL